MRKIRRRSDQEPIPAAAAPPVAPPPPPRRTAAELTDGRRGAAAGMWALARRKLRELRGRRWEGATERERHREAEKRAREELASRIEAETGKRPSDRTLRRHAAAGTVPRGMDPAKTQRQAAIDNAGSIAKFARMQGMTEYAVKRWRDEGGELPERIPESLRFHVVIVATLFSRGERYKIDTVWVTEIVVDGDAVARVAEAAHTGDYGPVIDLVGELAADQFPWVGPAERVFEVSEVVEISIAK